MNVKNMAIIGAVVGAAAAIVVLTQGKKAEPAGAAAKRLWRSLSPWKSLPAVMSSPLFWQISL